MIDEILVKYGLKYEDLSIPERATLNVWLNNIQEGQMSIPKIQEYLVSMREAVETELTKHDLGSKQDLFLKARLRNYMLLSAFLVSPEKAKEQLENAIAGIAGKR
jgi:hypothetical protein